jgi:hypothetical protein
MSRNHSGRSVCPWVSAKQADLMLTMSSSGAVQRVETKAQGNGAGLERVSGFLQGIGLIQKAVDVHQTATIGSGPLPPAVEVDRCPCST